MKINICALLVCFLTVTAFANNATTSPAIDIAALSKQYQAVNVAASSHAAPKLLVFVSFSMPKDSLQALQREVGEIGGQLVIRGLIDNSLKKTAAAVSDVLDNGQGGLLIDPARFQQYHISQVPAFVVTDGQDDNNYDVVYGNVSLEAALTELSNKGDSTGDSAKAYLSQLHARTQV